MERRMKVAIGGKQLEGFEVPILESTEKWTELKLEDGAVIRIKPSVLGVIRLEGRWDQENNPVYAFKGGPNITTVVSAPDHLKRPTDTAAPKKAN